MDGIVLNIFVAHYKGGPMVEFKTVYLSSTGIIGDRYEKNQGSWSKPQDEHRPITLFSLEDLEVGNQLRQNNGLALFCPEETRRNLFTQGIRLAQLTGCFQIGDVVLEYTGPCTPCERPAALAQKPDFATYFHGGIRARIIYPGIIRQNDPITPLT